MAMEIEGGILLLEVQFKKLYKIYSLRVLKMQKITLLRRRILIVLRIKRGEINWYQTLA